jgi:hypothetical protein
MKQKILHVCGYFDPSGDVTRSVAELNKYSAYEHTALIKWRHPQANVLQFPEPEYQSPIPGIVSNLFEAADAIIYHLVGWNCPVGYNYRTLKPTAFRNANVLCDCNRHAIEYCVKPFYCMLEFFANPMDPAYDMVASCHMAARDFMGEQTAFLPALMPINDALYTPDWSERQPCVAYIKHEYEIAERLLDTPLSFSMGLAGMPHESVMKTRRSKATVTIDNVTEGHYGLAGTESLAQGIPAIAWNHPRTLQQLEDISPWIPNPFIEADNIRNAVHAAKAYLQKSKEEQEWRRSLVRKWIEDFYNSQRLIARYWDPFCERLLKA